MLRTILLGALTASLLSPSLSAQLVFAAPKSIEVNQTSFTHLPTAAGDVDGDGLPDVVIAYGSTQAPLHLAINRGDGSLFAPTVIDNGSASALELVDLNDDGLLDLLTAGLGLELRMGLPNAAFGPPSRLFTGTTDLNSLTVGDLTLDGLLDVIVTEGDSLPFSGAVTLVPGLGGGGFAAPHQIDEFTTVLPSNPAVGDLDEDGAPDLALITTQFNSSQLYLYRNVGAGTGWATPITVGLGVSSGNSVQLDDLDGDGHLDLTLFTNAGLGVKLGNGDLTFQPTLVQSNTNATPGALADLDGDGLVDAVAYDNALDRLRIFQGAGDGSFTLNLELTGMGITLGGRIDLTDFDGDGRLDIGLGIRGPFTRYSVNLNRTYGPGEPWLDLGKGLPDLTDPNGAQPILIADGSLVVGTPFELNVARNGVKADNFYMILGLTELSSPFKGGTLVPFPTEVIGPLAHDASGVLKIAGLFPAGLPSGSNLFIQFWWVPSGQGFNYAATSAVKGTVP